MIILFACANNYKDHEWKSFSRNNDKIRDKVCSKYENVVSYNYILNNSIIIIFIIVVIVVIIIILLLCSIHYTAYNIHAYDGVQLTNFFKIDFYSKL